MENQEMSLPEKEMCLMLAGKTDELPFPLRELPCSDGTVQQEYAIPDDRKAEVFKQLYFFSQPPALEDIMYDIHEDKLFIVKEFRVIRWHGGNLIASPYFPHSGGMVVDWIAPGSVGRTVSMEINTVAPKPDQAEEEDKGL